MEAFSRLGHNVDIFEHQMNNYVSDPLFQDTLRNKLETDRYDLIFSFDYYPLLSEGAREYSLPYLSWIYDSPHYTLESVTLNNPCNRVFVFDYALADRYRSEGIETVHYLPLPVNTARLDRLLYRTRNSYKHDISFVGSLYNDKYNFYDQIRYLPDQLRGFLDGVIHSQQQIYGYDLAAHLITNDLIEEIGKYVKADLGEGFRNARSEIFRDMLRKKVTVNERQDLLRVLGERFNVDLFSGSKPPDDLPVRFCKTVDYVEGMPKVFSSSKINLNITLRSILTGIPLRVIDILGAGGFCLTNYQIELEEYFEDGRELVWYGSSEELIEKADYYLIHDAERERIAHEGHEAAARAFSYDVLLPKLLEIGLR